MDFANYRLEQDGLVICEPCLCISLFSDLDLSAPGSPDMLGPYRAFLDLFQGEVSYCRLHGDQMHPKRVTPELLQNLIKEMQDDKRRKKGGVMAEIRSGTSPKEFRVPSFDFDYSKIGKPHTALRINLPLPWFDSVGLAGVRAFLTAALSGFPLQAGYVGYCFSWKWEPEGQLDPYFLRWLQRHPGLMLPNFSHTLVSYHGLPDLGWITLLGAEYVQRLGGYDALRGATAHVPGIAYEDFPGDVLGLRIGEAPRLGDTHAGDTMEDYRALGKVLAPLHNAEVLIKGMTVAGIRDRDSPGVRAKWIKRFFPE